MRIAGFVKTSMVDYPGNIVSTIFLSGCNFRCPYCHNPCVVNGSSEAFSEDDVLGHLRFRKGLIDGVCVSGGEPTIHADLIDFLRKIKSLGLLVKLDTNGSNPEMLRRILDEKLADYIAMDVKSSFDRYHEACGVQIDMERISKSIAMIKNSNVEHEFRTTMVPRFFSKDDFEKVCKSLKGAHRFYIQQFDNRNEMIDNEMKKEKLYPPSKMEDFLNLAKPYFDICGLRNI